MGVTALIAAFAARGIRNARYLVAAGGGGGGAIDGSTGVCGSPGGAGGFEEDEGLRLTSGAYTITVGAGGVQNTRGGDSSIVRLPSGRVLIQRTGGGAGANGLGLTTSNANGGSGAAAGTAGAAQAVGQGIPSEGYNGGPTEGSGINRAGGGGGAGGPGQVFGVAGPGVSSDITGTTVEYCRGGTLSIGAPAAGAGSGGPGYPGNPGGGPVIGTQAARAGIVVIRYRGPARATGGTITTVGADTVHTFSTVGTHTLTVF